MQALKRTFASLGIKTVPSVLIGEKIKIDDVLEKEIEIVNFRIEVSKYPKNKTGKCLHMQIVLNGENRVVFTGSDILIEVMQQVSMEMLPITTKIKKEDNHFEFLLNV